METVLVPEAMLSIEALWRWCEPALGGAQVAELGVEGAGVQSAIFSLCVKGEGEDTARVRRRRR